MLMYALFDRKVREYGSVVLARNDEVARRMTADALKGSNSLYEKHPEDFDLMKLASMDMETGMITAEVPSLIAGLGDLLGAFNAS